MTERSPTWQPSNDTEHPRIQGFYIAGGWPSLKPIVHVAKHGNYWAVVTSPTLHRADAELMQRLMASKLNQKGYIRPL